MAIALDRLGYLAEGPIGPDDDLGSHMLDAAVPTVLQAEDQSIRIRFQIQEAMAKLDFHPGPPGSFGKKPDEFLPFYDQVRFSEPEGDRPSSREELNVGGSVDDGFIGDEA
jgi:hypothetical protein